MAATAACDVTPRAEAAPDRSSYAAISGNPDPLSEASPGPHGLLADPRRAQAAWWAARAGKLVVLAAVLLIVAAATAAAAPHRRVAGERLRTSLDAHLEAKVASPLTASAGEGDATSGSPATAATASRTSKAIYTVPGYYNAAGAGSVAAQSASYAASGSSDSAGASTSAAGYGSSWSRGYGASTSASASDYYSTTESSAYGSSAYASAAGPAPGPSQRQDAFAGAGYASPSPPSYATGGAAYAGSMNAAWATTTSPAPVPAPPYHHIVPWLPPSPAGTSLFCFALIMPDSYEVGLLRGQYQNAANLFACNEFEVYSNRSVEVTPGLVTRVVPISLKCKYGGEFKTALNTDIFIALWKKVVQDARYLHYDWTVKVDADAVFMADRLRVLLQAHKEGPRGAYLSNCRMGMHGPLEVLSRNAVTIWYHGIQRCVQHFTKLCSGPCLWGEDMFIDQCLQKVLNASREDEYQVMLEDHCDPPQDWGSCKNSTVAAFHPFKSLDGYRQCLASARK
mmetsp:Transcript_51348/g.164430  ORF Transcript_51348/g.164430 Transcript_51348/m.164430 type:complete len:510 (+) Transcript_51348:66-1595(+)